jgi:hypothetical protein
MGRKQKMLRVHSTPWASSEICRVLHQFDLNTRGFNGHGFGTSISILMINEISHVEIGLLNRFGA